MVLRQPVTKKGALYERLSLPQHADIFRSPFRAIWRSRPRTDAAMLTGLSVMFEPGFEIRPELGPNTAALRRLHDGARQGRLAPF